MQSLIEGLTTRDEQARQDIALIALDGAIGDDKPEMVVQIAEQVLVSRQETSPEDTVAFRIISDRRPEKSEEILQRLKRLNPQKAQEVASNSVAQEPPSRSEPAVQEQTPAAQVSAQASKIARVFSSIVYIQFRNPDNRALVVKLQQFLSGRGFFVPGVEQIDANFTSSIRYFHAEDEGRRRTGPTRASRHQGIPRRTRTTH